MANNKIIIGLVGEIGGGKDTVAKLLTKELEGEKTVSNFRFSNILRETLELWDIPMNRDNLQSLPVIMDNNFGEGALTRAMRKRIENDSADIIIINGVRWETDRDFIRSFSNNFLVYITAPTEVRFERIKARGENVGENDISLEEFMEDEKAKSESFIKEIGASADFKIDNNGTLEELQTKVSQVREEIV